jgi:hypothetical protein
MSRRTERDRRYTRRSFTGRQTLWSWTSRWLLIHQRAWLSLCECDQRHPPHHYNLHIQPACGGQDYHNYHIRYLGVQDAKYVWSVVDAPSGRERSQRVYTFSQRNLFGDVIDAASSSLVTDILNDVGDSTMWLPLVEYLPLVLFDLYRHDGEKTSRRSL